MNDTKSVNQVGSVLVEATKEEADITPTSGVSGINNKNLTNQNSKKLYVAVAKHTLETRVIESRLVLVLFLIG